MKLNFKDMEKKELRAYVLAILKDDEAIGELFSRRAPNIDKITKEYLDRKNQ